jgi:Trk-type K+ transport system membrane component
VGGGLGGGLSGGVSAAASGGGGGGGLGQNDFAEAFTILLACLSNIGPAMGSIGPVGDFSSLTEVSKLMMILWMLLGRLALMPILVMLSPGTWKER